MPDAGSRSVPDPRPAAAAAIPAPPPDDGIVLAAARGEDADQIVKLQYLCYQSEAELYGDHSIAPLTESVAELRGILTEGGDGWRDGATLVLVARRGWEVVAAVRGRLDGDTCRVGRLVTHPRLRRRGLASRLLAEIELRCPTAARFELFTGARSADNIRLYTRCGYRETRRAVDGGIEMMFLAKPAGAPA
ncbi:GNAT family N-acetyltransferase [Frankia sp. QA3]|uniref:GNAT family N-acetyltransferase n=1 Tax=Frankia sp. QA3 TaxID=710111 RepID=UPI000269CDF7|nr:GNAT family N-acetyltransferase [Frankia sp. QA3]EIV96167.1 putative acyltransferase [Frankia sp. QA3]